MYEDVLESLKQVWYTDATLLTNNLISDEVPHIDNKLVNRHNQSLEELSHLITQQLN